MKLRLTERQIFQLFLYWIKKIEVWVKERDNAPARLTLLEIPSRRELVKKRKQKEREV